MSLPGKTLALLLAVGPAMPLALGAGPVSYPIHLDEVARAVVAAHPELAGAAIELPELPEARETAPTLDAGKVEHWSAGSTTGHGRLPCPPETNCLAF